jgi:hypothetical protein
MSIFTTKTKTLDSVDPDFPSDLRMGWRHWRWKQKYFYIFGICFWTHRIGLKKQIGPMF